ncbi:general transcription factor IIF subunit 1-like [Scaptodrosophila lebanonensis]|uniref:Transcription initiation factor IIF subunit alpha n=1 Tax=Drosophila lebanonensis TaxID=7225 RepID=A0A6J2TUM6_DROLE|nr:general transcription factor IIF subunit 1-like [Scaptodrosophila lebanonensis]
MSKPPSKPKSGIGSVKEYNVRLAKTGIVHHGMGFNANLNVNFDKWDEVTIQRENNWEQSRPKEEEQPRYGPGTAYNGGRKRFRKTSPPKKYRAKDQPWILTVGGKQGRQYKGNREEERGNLFLFLQAKDGWIDAYPIKDWYNFQRIPTHKTLSAEEEYEPVPKKNADSDYSDIESELNWYDRKPNNRDVGRKGKQHELGVNKDDEDPDEGSDDSDDESDDSDSDDESDDSDDESDDSDSESDDEEDSDDSDSSSTEDE